MRRRGAWINVKRQTRRQFVKTTASAVAGASALGASSCFPEVGGRWPRELDACVAAEPLAPVSGRGRVVEVHDATSVIEEPRPAIQGEVVSSMLQEVIVALAQGAADPWRVLLPSAEAGTRIGIKVNCLNEQCPTSVAVTRALVDSLKQGLGLPGEQVLVWDRRTDELSKCGYTEEALGCRVYGTVTSPSDASGPGYERDFCTVVNGKTTHLSRILTRETDITINVPVLKTHGVSGVTAALKNIYGVIDNPGEFHKDLNEALPVIYGLPPVRERIQLTLLDALIAVTVGGTSSPPDTFARRLLGAQDPLALDLYALQLVNQLRQEKEIVLGDIDPAVTAWLEEGHRLGLGAREIELVEIVRG